MRRKLLNSSQQRWLYNNYREMSNEELAEKLTLMVLKENEKELAQCHLDLTEKCGYSERLKIVSRMRTLKNFKCVTVGFVKRKAKELGCGNKSALYISRLNRERAQNAYWKKIMPYAEIIETPYEWFKSFKLKDQKVALIEDSKRYKSMRTSICNWNREVGYKKGMVLVPEWNQQLKAVKVEAKSLYNE